MYLWEKIKKKLSIYWKILKNSEKFRKNGVLTWWEKRQKQVKKSLKISQRKPSSINNDSSLTVFIQASTNIKPERWMCQRQVRLHFFDFFDGNAYAQASVDVPYDWKWRCQCESATINQNVTSQIINSQNVIFHISEWCERSVLCCLFLHKVVKALPKHQSLRMFSQFLFYKLQFNVSKFHSDAQIVSCSCSATNVCNDDVCAHHYSGWYYSSSNLWWSLVPVVEYTAVCEWASFSSSDAPNPSSKSYIHKI